ncbi:MAG: sarcosine oxidase subunit gamma [Gammaproteobacteria bacterium]|nr:sarcosine oxidase subunit gamma [Gammaproteobacteria bacterium]
MAEFTSKSPLAGILADGLHGAVDGEPGVTIRETSRPLLSVSPRAGARERVSEILQEHLGVTLPEPGRFAVAGDVLVLWAGLEQWMVAGAQDGHRADLAPLAGALAPYAAVVDQDHGRAIVRLSGPHAREVLARLCAVDVHPRSFGPGRVAATRMAHVASLLTQLDDAPTFEIHVMRSFAVSFFEELTAAAAPFGFRTIAHGAEPRKSS